MLPFDIISTPGKVLALILGNGDGSGELGVDALNGATRVVGLRPTESVDDGTGEFLSMLVDAWFGGIGDFTSKARLVSAMAMRKGVLTKGISPKTLALSRKASSKSLKVLDSFGYVSFNFPFIVWFMLTFFTEATMLSPSLPSNVPLAAPVSDPPTSVVRRVTSLRPVIMSCSC